MRATSLSTPNPARTRSRRILSLFAALVVLAGGVVGINFAMHAAEEADAANARDFRPGMLISDADFYNASTMDAPAIQRFLDSKVSRCTPGYTCLRAFGQATTSKAPTSYCGRYDGAPWESAASIIAKVSAACGINPQVILVMLEKEASLITMPNPSPWRYSQAMGYACPDTAPCDSGYAGFFNQVYNAASQFQRYRKNPNSYNYVAGRVNTIGYHPRTWEDGRCGSERVYIENQATAGLYNYTPYIPNATALNDLYGGSDDGCSAYGNRNFWRDFTDWFGSLSGRGPSDPFGSVDEIRGIEREIAVRGWAVDPDAPRQSLYVWVTIDGRGQHLAANRIRGDVGAALPGYGNAHGFQQTIPASPGQHEVCITAHNVGAGKHYTLSCKKVTVEGSAPRGVIDEVTAGARTVTVRGWTIDPDGRPPRYVWVHIDGQSMGPVALTENRPDVQKRYPRTELASGYKATFAAAAGPREVCVTAVNSGPGSDRSLGCRTVTVAGDNPMARIDSVTPVRGGVVVNGWAFDPNTPTSTTFIWVEFNGTGRHIAANTWRPDVNRAYPGVGNNHGFSETIKVPSGESTLCLTAHNSGPGDHVKMGCYRIRA